jgi:hypothetical protein
MIQIVAVPRVSSLAEYVQREGDVTVERPSRCENPTCGRSNGFWRHTGYKRTAREGELSVELRIERFLCKYCGLVVSCLFDFLIPYVVFTASLVGAVVQEYGCAPTSYRNLSGNNTPLNSAQDGAAGPRPSHVQIFRWVRRVAMHSKVLLTYVQKFVLQAGVETRGTELLACPNSWKAITEQKQHELDDLLRLLVESSRCNGSGLVSPVDWMHRYFLQSGSICRAILSGRGLKLSTQQRAKHRNY